jgi:hypothetical protein
MKKVIKKTLIVLAALILIFLVIVALQPSDFKVVRTAKFAATAPTAFAQVNDFHNWEAWSPWAKLDPNSKSTFEGPTAGTGATFKWAGNDKVGEGRMTIIESHPSDLIRIDLEFIKPFAGTSLTEFTFKPDGDQTLVTWSMSGHNNFLAKAVCMFMNMDKTVGGDFEKGLAQMKAIAEASKK